MVHDPLQNSSEPSDAKTGFMQKMGGLWHAERLKNLSQRAKTGFILAPLWLFATYTGGILYHLVILGMAVLAMREWVLMVARGCQPAVLQIALAVVAVMGLASLLGGVSLGFALIVFGTAVMIMVGRHYAVERPLVLAGGVLYLAPAAFSLIWLRNGTFEPYRGWFDQGAAVAFFLLAVVWLNDIAAYFAGITFGGPKLMPEISPNKTRSGAIAGIIAGSLAGVVVALLNDWRAVPAIAVIAACLVVVSQAGDLFESAVKRAVEVKDSGDLMPGHGGLLDRIDGLLFAAPVWAMIMLFVGRVVVDPCVYKPVLPRESQAMIAADSANHQLYQYEYEKYCEDVKVGK